MKHVAKLVIVAAVLINLAGLAQAGMMKNEEKMKGTMKEGMVMDKNSKYCPVCMLHGKKMMGTDHFMTEYKGKIYRFASFDHQKMFVNNPEEFMKGMEITSEKMDK